MAPAFDPQDSSSDSQASRPQSRAQAHLGDDMASYEATYREGSIQPSPEVEFFAAELDRFNIDPKGAAEEQRARVLGLIESYRNHARQRADRLYQRHAHQRSAQGGSWQRGHSADMDVDEAEEGDAVGSEEIRRAEEEAQTWDLLHRILPLRYPEPDSLHPESISDLPPKSRKQWWDDFLLSDSVARERKIVLEWLQTSASYGPPIDEVVSELQQNAERGDILAHGWLHTRAKIKLQKSVQGYQGVLDPYDAGMIEPYGGSATLITQLDPDAITRQARKLQPGDEFFERAIWLGCFEMLRRGCSMADIREWCSVRTELWRAASIAPLPLSNPEEDEDDPNFDPNSLVLWRRICFATARDGGTSDYDRAVYGLLAGDINSVEKVCKSWDDMLFLHYNALLRTQFDSFLINYSGEDAANTSQQFPAFNVVLHHGDGNVGGRLISTFETEPKTRIEAERTLKALQGAIVANQLGKHLQLQAAVLSKQANEKHISNLIPAVHDSSLLEEIKGKKKFFDLSDHNSLRIFAHIVIITTALDQLTRSSPDLHSVQEHMIAAYISYLRLVDLEEMIPLYCSKLSSDKLYTSLTRNLKNIVDMDARRHQLIIMQKLGLDIEMFATTQPDLFLSDVHDEIIECEARGRFKILEDGPATLKYGRIVKADFFGEDAEFVDEEDEYIIRSLEWMLLVPGLLVETCAYVIRAYKYFLKRTRLRAARALSDRVSGREIARTKTPVHQIRPHSTEDPNPGWFEEFADADLSDDFLAACNLDKERLTTVLRNVWELECLVRALDSVETLSSLAVISREDNGNTREMLQHMTKHVRLAKACMEPVLRGWLLTTNTADRDFSQLRDAYIPETVLAYASSLHFAGTSLSRDNLLECMELAAVIAEKGSDVASQFMRAGRMKELVEAFASCSKALAIWTSDKKGSQTTSKKMREMGWSRELWSIKPEA
ncbi:nuclear pore protein 84/107 [Podospora didyma]|uniref:Nuclear pore complex protein n=1 Tax=Podospora didyma TaxID=330526 RepID=A0AAE0U8U7_9PEZI|nr:nuclear pore protein 84/107 [Podospora didyma]